MRLTLLTIIISAALAAHGLNPEVTYLESIGNNGGTRVFAVTTPAEKNIKVDNTKLQPNELACMEVMKAILFEGVENYNQGNPLVANTNDVFAKSLVNPQTKTFMSYFKDVQLENSSKNEQAYHFIVELNNFNLIRLLKMRGSIK